MIEYLVAINIITLIAFGIDKLNAIRGGRRIRVATLIGLSLMGGSLGGLIAMYLFRHKTRKPLFFIGLPLMVIAQSIAIMYLFRT